MKRALKKRVKAVLENTTGEETPVETSNVLECGGVRRKRTQAAMIGLAISMGATSLLVTRQSDQALAAAPVGNQNTASTNSAADTLGVKSAATTTANFRSVSRVSVPENSAIVEPTATSQIPGLGAKWQFAASNLPRKYQQSGTTGQLPGQFNPEKSTASKGARIASAIVKTKQVSASQASESVSVDAQLKAQQEYAIKHLQRKSDRLRASLTELRSDRDLQTSPVQTVAKQKLANSEPVNPRLSQLKTSSAQVNRLTLLPQKVYEVRPGDTLAAIASNNGTSVAQLMAANKISNPHQLQIRQKLAIPVALKQETVPTSVPIAATASVASGTLASSNTGKGGSTPVPTVFAEMERRKNSKKQAKVDPGLQSLQAEIERLRQKYREQQSGKRVNSPTRNRRDSVAIPVENNQKKPVNQPVAIPVPTVRQNQIAAPARTNNYFKYNTAPVAIPVPSPSGQPNYANQEPVKSGWSRRNARNVEIPVPTANRIQSPSNMRGLNVSPQLPPLAAVDRYLPKPIEEKAPASKGLIWPAKGTLTSGYGPRWGRMHRGIDIANSVGTPIYAAADGVVTKAGWNNGGYGYLVDIRHANGTLTRYAHNSRIMVRKGERVKQGQQISAMGSTGFSTGPHLHFEVRPKGKGAKNPIAFLPPRR